MIPIVCIDDRNGLMFNHRRQSMDECLRMDVLQETAPNKLWMNQYTARQFHDSRYHNLCVNENFLELAERGEYCFVEDQLLSEYQTKIEKMIIYRWNRRYPADFYLDLNLSQSCWKCISTIEFVGKSHKSITKEVYSYER